MTRFATLLLAAALTAVVAPASALTPPLRFQTLRLIISQELGINVLNFSDDVTRLDRLAFGDIPAHYSAGNLRFDALWTIHWRKDYHAAVACHGLLPRNEHQAKHDEQQQQQQRQQHWAQRVWRVHQLQ